MAVIVNFLDRLFFRLNSLAHSGLFSHNNIQVYYYVFMSYDIILNLKPMLSKNGSDLSKVSTR